MGKNVGFAAFDFIHVPGLFLGNKKSGACPILVRFANF
jgi:hypothetical protein